VKIGKYEFDKPKILAPMAGSTDISFREFVYGLGADFAVTEMIMANSLIYKNPKGFLLMERGEFDDPFVLQLAASEKDIFLKTLDHIKNSKADILDINMGCPAKKIVKKGAGSALLKDPKKVYDIIKSLKDALDIPVTVKIRLGFDSLTYKEVLKSIERAGADAVTVHRRTQLQQYGAFYPESIFEEIRELVSIPFICNGEIKTQEDIDRMFTLGCDGVMLGRQAIKTPWVFSGLKEEITLEERHQLMKKHFSLIVKYYGKERAVFKMKKFYGSYVRGVRSSKAFKSELMLIDDYNIVMEKLELFYKNNL